MTPDASRWRSSADYDHVEDLTASNLAWEWLRRNEEYDKDFQALAGSDADLEPLTEDIRQRWGLRFPDRPDGPAAQGARVLVAGREHERCRPGAGAGAARRKP